MACDRYLELLSARLDGALTEAEERELEEHLAACPDCRAVGAQLSALRGAFPELEEDAPPEGFARGVMERIRAEEPKKVIPLFKRPQVRALAGLAACLVLVVGIYGISQLRSQEKMMLVTRSFQHDVMWEETIDGAGDVSARESLSGEADAPQVTAYAAGSTADIYNSDTENTFSDIELRSKSTEAPAAPSHYFFTNQQTVRLSWTEELDAPSARILGSEQSLETFAEQFPEDSLEEVLEPYDAGYFAQNRLLAVVLKEGSGSISHSIGPQSLYRDEVEITRTVPEEVTYDMAAWLILAEVDATFHDGDELEVIEITNVEDVGESGLTVIQEEDGTEY